jgi:S1-C subfamily serine protease
VGEDPLTDIALKLICAKASRAHATLGDSDGWWWASVMALGSPLALQRSLLRRRAARTGSSDEFKPDRRAGSFNT